jgi:beta-D-xylosidase 4
MIRIFSTGHPPLTCKEIRDGAEIKRFQVSPKRVFMWIQNSWLYKFWFIVLSCRAFFYLHFFFYFSFIVSVLGEDPFLTGQYAKAFVQGLQQTSFRSEGHGEGDDDKDSSDLKMGACCKHFLGNSLEHWNDYDRHSFDAHIDQEDLNNYYLPPFEECTKHAVGVMCSYNAVNGEPTCASDWLLKDVLRGKMNFTGYIVTDCGALDSVVHGHHFAIDNVQASVSAT